MKTEMIALLQMTVVLCSVFLVTLLGFAAEQNPEKYEMSASTITTSSEDNFLLGIYGNANEDDTIDMRDLTYVKLIFFGKKLETELADAKYDDKINPLDFIQIKLISVGKEKEITVVDSADRIVTVKKPVERIIAMNSESAKVIRAFKEEDKIVGVSTYIARNEVFFPDLPNVGTGRSPDYEKIIGLEPDILIYYAFWPKQVKALEEKLEPTGISLVCLDCFYPQTMYKDIKKLSYILDCKEDVAKEFIDWYGDNLDKIKSRTEELSEDEKPLVYLEGYTDYSTCSCGSPDHAMCIMAGGVNIASDLIGSRYPEYPKVDSEWVLTQNPDIIIKQASRTYASLGYSEDNPMGIKKIREKILERPELANIAAVKNGSVYLVPSDISREPEFVVAVAYMAKWFHPSLFEDLDPETIHREYLTRFLRLDYDLDEQGIFAYPPIEIDDSLAGIPDRYLYSC